MSLFGEELITDYGKWLKKQMKTQLLSNDWTEITTPFTNRSNDLIQVFVKKTASGDLQLTDSGDTLDNLVLAGYKLTPEKKRKLEKNILLPYGLNLNHQSQELTLTCATNEFPQRLHDLIQAIIQVDDLALEIKTRGENYFLEEVWDFISENKVFASKNIRLTGLSTYTHKFDLLILGNSPRKEYSVKIINNLKKDYLFSFEDVRKIREETEGAVIVNNEFFSIKTKERTAFENYNIEIFAWSDREEWIQQFRPTG